MKSSFQKFLSTLVQACVIFFGVYGAVFCVITAYDVKLETGTVIFYYIISSIIFSAVFFAEKYRIQILISSLGITLTVGFINYTNIYNGFALFLNQITLMFNKFASTIKVTDEVNLSRYSKIEASTTFFSFIGVVLIIIAAYLLVKRSKAGLLTILLSSVFSLSLIFIKKVPDNFPLICYVCFLFLIMITNLARKKDKIANSKIYAAILPIILVFLIVIGAVFPPQSYVRTDFAGKMYSFFAERFPITVKSPGGEGSYGTGSDYSLGEDGSGVISDPGYNKPSDGVNLSQADPSKLTDKKVMTIVTDRTGGLLLRGYSFGNYTGNAWEKFDKNKINDLNQKLFVNSIPGYTGSTWCNPVTLATYTAFSSSKNKKQYRITLTDEYTGGEIAFLPYFSIIGNGPVALENDSVTYYSPNINNTLKSKASYEITFFNCDEIASGGSPDKNIYDSDSLVKVRNFESQNRQNIYNYYTYMDSDTRDFISVYTKQFSGISDRAKVIESVASFVKNNASYNISAAQTPDGKDFVKYFLEESKEGSCMHFASAATLMYRSLGIPARFVMGYAVNVNNNQAGKSVNVIEKDSHAWVEVYIDGVGWIPVDVTPGSIGNRPGETSGDTSGTINVESETSVIVSGTSNVHVSGEVPYNPVSSESDISVEESDISDESDISSSDTLNTSSEESEFYKIPFYIKYKNTLAWLCPTLAVILLAVYVILRRLYILKKRKDTYKKADRNIAAIEAWHYIEKLITYGLIVDKAVYRTAQKAVFSKHQLTEEELKRIIGYAELKSEEIYNKLDFFKQFVFKFIKAMK